MKKTIITRESMVRVLEDNNDYMVTLFNENKELKEKLDEHIKNIEEDPYVKDLQEQLLNMSHEFLTYSLNDLYEVLAHEVNDFKHQHLASKHPDLDLYLDGYSPEKIFNITLEWHPWDNIDMEGFRCAKDGHWIGKCKCKKCGEEIEFTSLIPRKRG